MATALVKGPDRGKRDEWSEIGVLLLLDVYESKWRLRNRAKLKGTDWEDIARQVNGKTPIQCKNKIESMKKRYRAEPRDSSWQFYCRMDVLLKGSSPTGIDLQAPVKEERQVETNLQDGNHDVVTNTLLAPVDVSNNNEDVSNTVPTPIDVTNVGGNENGKTEDDEGKGSADIESDRSVPGSKVAESEEREVGVENGDRVKRRKGEGSEIAESVRMLANSMMKIEESRMEMYRDSEKMRMEMDIKRGEMELKRTEIIAKTQLQIAKLFVKNFSRTSSKSDGSISRSEVDTHERKEAVGD